MSDGSDPPAPRYLPVTPLPPSDAAILLTKPAIEDTQGLAPSASEGNASAVLVSGGGRKPVWGRTSNGGIDAGAAVMGSSDSWPALSETAKVSTKSSSDGVPSAPGPVNPPPMQRNSPKRGGGGSSGCRLEASGNFSSNAEPSTSSPDSISPEISHNVADKQPEKGNYGNRDRSPRESPSWVDQRDRQRRHGGGSRRGNYGNRSDQDRGGHEWNSSRGLSGRVPHTQRSNQGQLVMRPPMTAVVPFIGPHMPFQPFPGPVAFPDPYQLYYFPIHPHPESFRGLPFVPYTATPIQQHMFFPSPDQQRTSILKQIEYYFSPENLCKDVFLRKKMDEHGWVPISLIAGFNRVRQLTDNKQLILDVVRFSDVVEVQGDKIRRRHGWSDWILNPKQNQYNESESTSQATANQLSLVSHVKRFAIADGNEESNGQSCHLDLDGRGL